MALPSTRAIPLLLIPFFSSLVSTVRGGVVGVSYGTLGDNLMPPAQVVQLLKANSINYVSIFNANQTILRAFSGSGIGMTVSLPNEDLPQAALSATFAANWVRTQVAPFVVGCRIQAIAVGNEVFYGAPYFTIYLVPAMQNIANALASQGLANIIKVSTPIAFDAVVNSFPPSDGTFREDLLPVMRDITNLITQTGSFMMINIYPYRTYMDEPMVPLDYALGRAQTPVVDPKSGRSYYSLFDAQLDAFKSALRRIGYGNTVASTKVLEGNQVGGDPPLRGSESGWPSGKNPGPRAMSPTAWKEAADGPNLNASLLVDRRGVATIENAQKYNTNLIQRILAGKTGTPLYPNANMDVYIFSLFNENLKPGDPTEQFYGLFHPDGQKVYDFSFQRTSYTPTPTNPPPRQTWCEANPAVGAWRLQQALKWACRVGKVDCRPILPGAPCFNPNTVEAHATFAFNSYYQRERRFPSACDFNGAARIVTQPPRMLSPNCTNIH